MSTKSPDDIHGFLSDCFFDTQSFMDRMNDAHYDNAFLNYKTRCAPIVSEIDRGLQDGDTPLPAILAQQLIDRIAAGWDAELAASPKIKKHRVETRDQMFLALYLIPMLLETGVPNAMPLAEAIRDEWCRRYPKMPIVIGRYADISAGFRKKPWGMCFLTTAVCEFEKKPDDCPELTALRRFRDQYMMKTPGGRALVRQYYEIAPKLVVAIDLCSDRESVYADLRDRYIRPCLAMIGKGRLSDCQSHYCAMIRHLQEMFSM
ncbi:MAG: hypothetical protein HFE83_11680 [Lachnospiraceae bacterium]|jgi:hypothetical protein|nr:hypothetical protein [Lachnospiraceae bacterium]